MRPDLTPAFEAWAKAKRPKWVNTVKLPDGSYASSEVNAAWEGAQWALENEKTATRCGPPETAAKQVEAAAPKQPASTQGAHGLIEPAKKAPAKHK